MPGRNEYPISPGMSETQFQNRVIHEAIRMGWMVNHQRPSLNRSGKWSTATQGHTGFPDLVLARGGVVLLVELKTDKGRMSAPQKEWQAELGPFHRLWRPRDWPEIVAELKPKVRQSRAIA